jgi:hypothetical protein
MTKGLDCFSTGEVNQQEFSSYVGTLSLLKTDRKDCSHVSFHDIPELYSDRGRMNIPETDRCESVLAEAIAYFHDIGIPLHLCERVPEKSKFFLTMGCMGSKTTSALDLLFPMGREDEFVHFVGQTISELFPRLETHQVNVYLRHGTSESIGVYKTTVKFVFQDIIVDQKTMMLMREHFTKKLSQEFAAEQGFLKELGDALKELASENVADSMVEIKSSTFTPCVGCDKVTPKPVCRSENRVLVPKASYTLENLEVNGTKKVFCSLKDTFEERKLEDWIQESFLRTSLDLTPDFIGAQTILRLPKYHKGVSHGSGYSRGLAFGPCGRGDAKSAPYENSKTYTYKGSVADFRERVESIMPGGHFSVVGTSGIVWRQAEASNVGKIVFVEAGAKMRYIANSAKQSDLLEDICQQIAQ